MSLGEELHRARLKAGYSQEELAFRADVSRNYISMLERDEKSPTVKLLLRLSKALGIRASKVIARIE